MFAKPFRVKSKTAMRGSEMRDLQDELVMTLPTLAPNELNELIPSNEAVIIVQLEIHKRKTATVFMIQGNPILFKVDKHLYPTVYTLWRYPRLLPTFLTWPIILERLVKGADLMLPGVVIPPDGLPSVQKEDICAIALLENRAPIAVGIALMCTSKMLSTRLQGRGFSVLHTYQDFLWQYGQKTTPPLILAPTLTSPDHSEDDSIDFEPVLEDNINYLTLEDDDDVEEPYVAEPSKPKFLAETTDLNERRNLQRQMDKLLKYCFFQALRYSVKKKDLPLLASSLLGNHMFSCCPDGQQIDIKKTSFKKMSAFLHQMQEENVLEVRELNQGVESIVAINWKHPKILPYLKEEATSTSQSMNKGGSRHSHKAPDIRYLYYAPASMNLLFQECGHKRGSPLDASDIRNVIIDYAKRNHLFETNDGNSVNLDAVLSDCILGKNEKTKIKKLSLDNLLSRCFEKMQPAYQITFPGQEPIVKKGEISPISITLAKRALNKRVTIVRNLEAYGLNPRSVASILRQRCHASASVIRVPGTKNTLQLQIQGNQIPQLHQLLLQEYHLPEKSVESRARSPRMGRK